MTDDQTIIDAVDLAERILEVVTRAEHDWPEIEHLADALAGLAAAAARTATDRRRATDRQRGAPPP
jgi:hypothetical protein